MDSIKSPTLTNQGWAPRISSLHREFQKWYPLIVLRFQGKTNPTSGPLAARISHDSTEPRWKFVTTLVALLLLALSVLLFAAYGTRNAFFKGDPNGDWTTLIFIRTGN
jgi:hypothetical protein